MKNKDLIQQIAEEEESPLLHPDDLASDIEEQLTEQGDYIHLEDPVDLDSAEAITKAVRKLVR